MLLDQWAQTALLCVDLVSAQIKQGAVCCGGVLNLLDKLDFIKLII